MMTVYYPEFCCKPYIILAVIAATFAYYTVNHYTQQQFMCYCRDASALHSSKHFIRSFCVEVFCHYTQPFLCYYRDASALRSSKNFIISEELVTLTPPSTSSRFLDSSLAYEFQFRLDLPSSTRNRDCGVVFLQFELVNGAGGVVVNGSRTVCFIG